jgi:hypothetical protein
MIEFDVVEKIKEILLVRDWQTVSIYKTENEIFVYVNGELVAKIPHNTTEGVKNE